MCCPFLHKYAITISLLVNCTSLALNGNVSLEKSIGTLPPTSLSHNNPQSVEGYAARGDAEFTSDTERKKLGGNIFHDSEANDELERNAGDETELQINGR